MEKFIVIIIIFLGLISCNQKTNQPNIVLIMADDPISETTSGKITSQPVARGYRSPPESSETAVYQLSGPGRPSVAAKNTTVPVAMTRSYTSLSVTSEYVVPSPR